MGLLQIGSIGMCTGDLIACEQSCGADLFLLKPLCSMGHILAIALLAVRVLHQCFSDKEFEKLWLFGKSIDQGGRVV